MTMRTTFSRTSNLALRLLAATSVPLMLMAPLAQAFDDVPSFMKEVAVNEGPPPPASQIAFNNVYHLNESMLNIYNNSLAMFQKNLRDRHPIILGLFTGKGGRFVLYRPGQEPLEAPSPPAVYRMAKACGHCGMATYELVAPYCGGQAKIDSSWQGPMRSYRTEVQVALDSMDNLDTTAENRELLKKSLQHVIAFMDKCLQSKDFTYQDVETYARGFKPIAAQLITLASSTQVGHWYKVLEEWKKMIGPDWDKTYALSNSIYVARQNNILFSVLVQFMGEKTINDRLLLLETTDFTTTPDEMLTAMTRIIADRALGKVFFNDYYLMDYELLAGGGRRAIEAEAAKRGAKAILPPLVPFNSRQWPMRIDLKSGTGAATLEDVK